MKTGRTKHVVTLLAVLLISCLLIGTIDLSFADSDTYYPGPDVTPEEPIIIVTPTSEPEVTPTPTPRPTPTTAPTPAITPEPSVPVPVITPVPKKEKEPEVETKKYIAIEG